MFTDTVDINKKIDKCIFKIDEGLKILNGNEIIT